MRTLFILSGLFLTLNILPRCEAQPASTNAWLKGNLHTHSLWSDGDDYPEMIAEWYKTNGYNFLAFTEHNTMQVGERWTAYATNRGGSKAFEKYLKRHGTNWVAQKTTNDVSLVRLKTYDEVRALLDEHDKFILIPAEEISARYKVLPIHINVSNLREVISPQTGDSPKEVIQQNVNAVREQRKKTGQPMIPHVNHPNFGWALTAEDIMGVEGENFFEVYNGHPSVHNEGDADRASTERMWDIILTHRLSELNMAPIWGTAVDDSHHYHGFEVGKSNPGRGWLMVQARELTPTGVVEAMEAGDFYASSGVVLKKVDRQKNRINLSIKPEDGVTYITQFIGTRKGYDKKSEAIQRKDGSPFPTTRRYSADIGTVLAEVKGTSPSYEMKGDEIYVRAAVVSSKSKVNPYKKGEVEKAWVQPVVTGVK